MVRKRKGRKCTVVNTCVHIDDVGWGWVVKGLNALLQKINA